MNKWFKLASLSFLLFGCNSKKEPVLFELLDSEKTGITFNNQIVPTNDLNIFRYMYFYNGAGVGAGDFNNDGLIDVFFSSNQGENELYLNKGNLKFANISDKAGISNNGGWSTGVSVVDINQDGLLDIYVSQVGDFEVLKGHNLLFICEKIDQNGIPIFSEKSKEYGLDLVGFGTQAVFFDYDLDGDLDFFQVNHSVHQNGTFGKRENFLNTKHPLAGDRFFENINGKYLEKSDQSGINQNALGYGLGLAVSDVNLDGYPDIYVGNDFHENDYLYINQKNGRFIDELSQRISHTSRFSMGIDIADLNHDIFPEIVTLDMLPFNHEILKRSEGEDTFYNFEFKLKQGYDYQFARNNLQYNNGNGVFSEIGMSSNISATDWSWSSLFDDFDNDGETDLFISNGIAKRMNDTDYINIVSNDEIQKRIQEKTFDESDEALTDLIPEIKIPNKLYLNKGDLSFQDAKRQIVNNKDSFSNGAISVDLDNDGDLDIITNNINAQAFIYENKTISSTATNEPLKIQLKGSDKNKNGIGTKIIAYANNQKYYKEKFPVRGFQSSSEAPLIFATKAAIDSIWVIWPDNSFQSLKKTTEKSITIQYQTGLPQFDYLRLKIPEEETFIDVTDQMLYKPLFHQENTFNEFDREALIPSKMSTQGPAVAVGDLNGDGLDDLYFGGSRKEKSKVLFQTSTGILKEFDFPDISNDSLYEDVDAIILDANNDGLNDIIVLSGGNEYLNKSEFNSPRLYLNHGQNVFKKSQQAFPLLFTTAQCIKAADFDNDGDLDVFIGSRTYPWAYGKIPPSYLLLNDGKGHFTIKNMPVLENLGMVKDALWMDIDQDNDPDLIVVLEWDGVFCLENNNGEFIKKSMTDKKGWWNIIYPTDINNDGKTDFILGNLGENSRLKATENKPVRMYVKDLDENGRLDQILTYYLEEEEVIFADKKELEKQMPFIRKKYNLAKDFAKADFRDVFGQDKIKDAKVFEANYFKSAILLNMGNGSYRLDNLPWKAQVAPISAVARIQGSSGYLIAGNFFDSNIQLGRYDAGIGGILDKNGNYHNIPGITLREQIRQILPIKINGESHYLVIANNAAIRIIKKSKVSS